MGKTRLPRGRRTRSIFHQHFGTSAQEQGQGGQQKHRDTGASRTIRRRSIKRRKASSWLDAGTGGPTVSRIVVDEKAAQHKSCQPGEAVNECYTLAAASAVRLVSRAKLFTHSTSPPTWAGKKLSKKMPIH